MNRDYNAQPTTEHDIFNPGPCRLSSESESPKTYSGKLKVPKVCWHFDQKTIHCISDPFSGEPISITVYREAQKEVYRLLKNASERHSGSYANTFKLYVWLRLLSILKITHMKQTEMAKMLFSGHEERLKSSISDLEQLGLVKKEMTRNNHTGRSYYKYYAFPLEIEISHRDDVIIYSYNYSLKAFENCKRTYLDKAWIDQGHSIATQHIEVPNIQHSSFETILFQWYDELEGIDDDFKVAYISKKDGRYYHPFHHTKKDQRCDLIRWKGERVVEIWDASASFYISLCYMLRQKVLRGELEQRDDLLSETEKMLLLCIDGVFYEVIQHYYTLRGLERPHRGWIKILCQKYRTRWRMYFFKKNGDYKNTWYVKELRYIDEYFKENFPNIRNYILDSEVVLTENPYFGKQRSNRQNKTYIDWSPTRRITRVNEEVVPYETELISKRVCKILYEEYGIESISLHDAIYVKESILEPYSSLSSTIDLILMDVLDVHRPQFQYSDVSCSTDEFAVSELDLSLYHINLNTLNSAHFSAV